MEIHKFQANHWETFLFIHFIIIKHRGLSGHTNFTKSTVVLLIANRNAWQFVWKLPYLLSIRFDRDFNCFHFFPYFHSFHPEIAWSGKLENEAWYSQWLAMVAIFSFKCSFHFHVTLEDPSPFRVYLRLRAQWMNELIIKCSLGKPFTAAILISVLGCVTHLLRMLRVEKWNGERQQNKQSATIPSVQVAFRWRKRVFELMRFLLLMREMKVLFWCAIYIERCKSRTMNTVRRSARQRKCERKSKHLLYRLFSSSSALFKV